ncbi:glycoside hydrolase family 1 protein [Aspergillus lucknowensis]|uniref:Glycoside hydrolase family 1 protein n=1 Tax=Aspergillus lucknowensis TaxID=176173 RepID=A0ABR4LT75_9EURO
MAYRTVPSRPELKDILPADFLHGYASAAYQVEGATSKDGRGPCNWDEFLKDYPDKGDDACRSYDLWQDDVKLLQQYGAKSYRFSISWSRVKPLGGKNDPVNEAGIQYYNNLINALVDAGIEPTVTLYHYDTPLALDERYRGFAASDPTELIDDFVAYAKLCFAKFGDRVKRWLTINEPWIFCSLGGEDGLVKGYTRQDFFRVGHNCLLVHGNVARVYHREFCQQRGQIGIALKNYDWVEPIDNSPEAIKAAQIAEERSLGWWAQPIFKGTQTTAWDHYGSTFPKLTNEELDLVFGSADFFSINHYGTMYATGRLIEPYTKTNFRDLDDVEKTHFKHGKPIGRRGENGHPHTVPWGFGKMLIHVWKTYAEPQNQSVYVYENGYSVEHEASFSLEDIINDQYRQEFYDLYIGALCDVVRNHGVKIAGYHCWSLLDNLEWNFGYKPRFGLTYVDRENGFKRIPKNSAMTVAAIWDHVVAKT